MISHSIIVLYTYIRMLEEIHVSDEMCKSPARVLQESSKSLARVKNALMACLSLFSHCHYWRYLIEGSLASIVPNCMSTVPQHYHNHSTTNQYPNFHLPIYPGQWNYMQHCLVTSCFVPMGPSYEYTQVWRFWAIGISSLLRLLYMNVLFMHYSRVL